MISFPTSLPTTKSLASIRLIQRTQSAFYRSPFNGAMQVQSNQGEWWEAQVQFPPMKRYQAEDYLATLMGLRGPQGAIYLGDTNAKTAQGQVGRIGTNLFLWSQSFDNAAWTKNASSISANATAAPDGNTTADKLIESAANDFHEVRQDEVSGGSPRCISVYAKPAGRNWIYIMLGSTIVYFDVNTGAIGGGAGGSVVATITASSNGFYRCSVYNPNPSSGNRRIGSASGNGGSIYAGDGTSGVYLWGAQNENATSPSTYISTLDGGSILVNGASQTGRILLVDGCPPNTTVWKRGDYIQLGAGFNAARITTSGGSATTKALYDAGVSSNGVTYLHQVRIWNCGTKNVSVIGSGTSQTVTPGTQTSISISHVGDGVAHAQLWFDAPTTGDSIDFVVWDPVIRRYGVYENLIALASRKFVGWGYSGATLTLTQKINQRLHKVMEDVTSDSSGNAEISLFPTLRHSPFDNEPLVTSSCKGVFRLANPQFDFNIDSDLAYGFSAQLVEAL